MLEGRRGIEGVFFSFDGLVESGESWEIESKESFAHVAQLAEHILGKDEVTSSILVMGSRFWRGWAWAQNEARSEAESDRRFK